MTQKAPQPDALVSTFSVEQVARISGMSRDMINYLCRYKLVVPTAGTKRGRGVARKYSYGDVLVLRIIAKLLKQGISVLNLRKNLTALQKRMKAGANVLTSRYVATDGYNLYFTDGEFLELFESGQIAFAFVVELSTIRSEITKSINRELKVA